MKNWDVTTVVFFSFNFRIFSTLYLHFPLKFLPWRVTTGINMNNLCITRTLFVRPSLYCTTKTTSPSLLFTETLTTWCTVSGTLSRPFRSIHVGKCMIFSWKKNLWYISIIFKSQWISFLFRQDVNLDTFLTANFFTSIECKVAEQTIIWKATKWKDEYQTIYNVLQWYAV